jgi:hypothetical protein
VDVEPVVAASREVVTQAEGEVADATADFEDGVLGSETAVEEFAGGDETGISEDSGIGTAIVGAAKVSRRHDGGTRSKVVRGVGEALDDTAKESGDRGDGAPPCTLDDHAERSAAESLTPRFS